MDDVMKLWRATPGYAHTVRIRAMEARQRAHRYLRRDMPNSAKPWLYRARREWQHYRDVLGELNK
jgi:hypothetical protein